MSIHWPLVKQNHCYDFRILATFDTDPRNVTVQYSTVEAAAAAAAASPVPIKTPHVAEGLESGTFVTVQPLYQHDNQVALFLRVTREEYLAGATPQVPSAYADVVRRANSFMGKTCITKISADYFIPVSETPKIIAVAHGPFKAGNASFEVVTGGANVKGAAVQVITWALTPHATWRLSLEAVRQGVMSEDIMRIASSEFDQFLLSFQHAEIAS